MNKIKLTLMALFIASVSFGQTATDFTATDCNAVSHNLYTELNAGKVVVIEWVMPCSACIGGATAAYNAVQSFATSHPGKVVNFLVDDDGGTSCSSLSSWATTNGMDITKMSVFGNSGNLIDEAQFGGSGMPHVIVISPNKTILLNLKNGNANNQTAITNAINLALAPLSVHDMAEDVNSITLYPNPSSTESHLDYNLKQNSKVVIELFDINGKLITELFNGNAKQGENMLVVNTEMYSAGTYSVKLHTNEGTTTVRMLVTK
jgi:hypothetical protein